APRLERLETPKGRKFDAWVIDGQEVGTLGAVMQAGQRFEDPSQIDFLGMWEDVRLGAYDPQAMVKENEMDGVWGSCLQPSQGLFWYGIPDSELLTAICRVYNDWIADFCKPFRDRLKGIAMLNVDDVEEASQELERCARLGLVVDFILVSRLAERPVFAKGWRSKYGLLPSDYWRRNMFVEFMEDDLGIQMRDTIGVDNMLWGSDFPHAESTWPKSREFLTRIFAGVPEQDLKKVT